MKDEYCQVFKHGYKLLRYIWHCKIGCAHWSGGVLHCFVLCSSGESNEAFARCEIRLKSADRSRPLTGIRAKHTNNLVVCFSLSLPCNKNEERSRKLEMKSDKHKMQLTLTLSNGLNTPICHRYIIIYMSIPKWGSYLYRFKCYSPNSQTDTQTNRPESNYTYPHTRMVKIG